MSRFASKVAGAESGVRENLTKGVLLGVVLALFSLAAAATIAADEASDDADADAVRQTAIEYIEAVETGDAEKAASFWTADGDLIDPQGKAVKARELFEKLAAGPRHERPKMTIKSQNLRFVRPDVALEDGSYEVAAVGDGRPTLRRFTAVWVKQDGQWLLDSVREAPLVAGRGSRLAPLAFLVGDWVEEEGETQTLISCKFNATKTYLLRTITVKQDGKVVFSGEQRIGWDPTTEQFRSWLFDLDGGRTEGDWRQDADTWVVEATGVAADGKQSTSTRVYQSLGPDQFTVESINGQADGEPLPDFKKTFNRVSESPAK